MQLGLYVPLQDLHHVGGPGLVVRECKRIERAHQVGRRIGAELFGVGHLRRPQIKTTRRPALPITRRLRYRAGLGCGEGVTPAGGAVGVAAGGGKGGVPSRIYHGAVYTTTTDRGHPMKLDRAAQLKILHLLADTFPEGRDTQQTQEFGIEPDCLNYQMAYLQQHGLVKCVWTEGLSIAKACLWAEITAAGLDFIADDGGLTAILGTVTIRFDSGQWAELLAAKVEKLEGVSHEERSRIASALRNLPAKAIEKVSEKMLDWAVDHAQDALPLLRMLLAQAAG